MALVKPIQTELILVDEQDRPVGTCEKMEAHTKGYLHRAFSVFIFDSQGRMLLQQRSQRKYHSGGLWSNACCSHPYPEEDTLAAGLRRLQEEMGFVTPLTKAFDFIYRAELDNGLIEHEFDHVLVGEYEGPMELNPEEVMAAEYVSISEIENRLAVAGDQYTVWFKIAFPRIMSHIKDKK